MNRQFRIKLSVILLFILIIAVSVYSSGMLQHSASTVAQPDTTLSSLSKYRTWTLVNPVPVKMERAVAQLCAAVVPRDRDNPHRDKFVSVYVNAIGRQAMMTQLNPEFPTGSMIVKEKLGSKESQSPELLTAMIKREKGYNPESGDWEYLVLDGNASEISERGKLANCSSCHVAYNKSDYVTRVYLSDEVRRQLK